MAHSDLPLLVNYLFTAENVTAINPIHNAKVYKLCEAHRRVDYHVDCAAYLEDRDSSARKHLRQEELWFDKVSQLEDELPRREVENAIKQLSYWSNVGVSA